MKIHFTALTFLLTGFGLFASGCAYDSGSAYYHPMTQTDQTGYSEKVFSYAKSRANPEYRPFESRLEDISTYPGGLDDSEGSYMVTITCDEKDDASESLLEDLLLLRGTEIAIQHGYMYLTAHCQTSTVKNHLRTKTMELWLNAGKPWQNWSNCYQSKKLQEQLKEKRSIQ